jgi:hypothetical protein
VEAGGIVAERLFGDMMPALFTLTEGKHVVRAVNADERPRKWRWSV